MVQHWAPQKFWHCGFATPRPNFKLTAVRVESVGDLVLFHIQPDAIQTFISQHAQISGFTSFFFVTRTGKVFATFPIASGHHVARIGGIWNRGKKQTKRVETLLSGGGAC